MAKETQLVWPVVTLPVLWVCLIVAHDHGASGWVIWLLFAGWWVGTIFYVKRR